MRVAIGSDHAGYRYKVALIEMLREMGHQVGDFGTDSEEPVDYPDYVRPAAEAVARGDFERGIVVGGSGNGEAMVANKVRDIRCALCWDVTTARLARAHNDANVLAIGQRVTGLETAKEMVRVFLATEFEGGRHQRRVAKIRAMEGDIEANEEVQRIVQQIVQHYQPQKIVAFGSYARGKADKDSDLDLLIIKGTEKDRLERARDVYRILPADRGIGVDVIVMTPEEYRQKKVENHYFIKEIEEIGRVLYEAGSRGVVQEGKG